MTKLREQAKAVYRKDLVKQKLQSLEDKCLATAEQFKRAGLGQAENDIRWICVLIEKIRNDL